ncbi:hypothetical protein GDO81_003241 [Engystomops pustulosus]|uniref:Uncharacterized protein n=1 Tax=Engystomops pustulosus TaxID=76066 RepID=A0AAV7A364_ENGPU|nr:hypothetical protein GDO81_003241 [Engystomops pustulosus]
MHSHAWGVSGLLLGLLWREVSAAGDALTDQNSENLPYWSIILISLACILVMAFLLFAICTICAIMKPQMYPPESWVRCYLPHLAFWGFDAEPNENV